jgi:glutamate-1-semialdehyde 2,1-aminomutase
MAAGLETLRYARDEDVYDRVNDLADRLRRGITEILAEHAPGYTVVGTDSVFKTVFTRDAPADRAEACAGGCRQRPDCPRYDACPKTGGDVADAATERWERVFWPQMRDHGVFLTANQYESQFVSAAHTEADVEETLAAYEAVLS